MDAQLTVVFDGEVFRPTEHIDLKPNTTYTITVHTAESFEPTNAWDVLQELTGTITMPQDWSENHQHYLYGDKDTSS
ncbi:hypothetical protein [Herpetosiphon llansteffanensis]|uniref:hypothetical protein n=1 Tax=Herpetosiphon llansteffanensis TaxID=2094568 RepID=UPI000D7C5648|nr:hypothetical protein [Herpetosiphon llansteffanensis]